MNSETTRRWTTSPAGALPVGPEIGIDERARLKESSAHPLNLSQLHPLSLAEFKRNEVTFHG
ncbi:hypothetical protein GCM10022402_29330 [Salinactinospora qingdaonensis]|uniref:Uncharacterized protein n=1 Tax=Salinactinospora qingdaonensis TaxID=702744 RepID=A0ABP7FWV0_9ACTN